VCRQEVTPRRLAFSGGDIILQIENYPSKDIASFNEAMKQYKG
jgi:hypothetical protein